MSAFGVRKNGQLTLVGMLTVTNLQTVTHSTIGGNLVVVGEFSAGAANAIYWTGRSQMLSPLDGQVAFKNQSASTYADIQVKDVDFRQPASTFAQVATMTNGPRAANPVAWVEVMVAGSTGRMPVW